MKKLIALALALALALCGVSALADALTTEKGITAELYVNVNGDAITGLTTVEGDMQKTFNSVVSLVNNLKIKASMKGESAQIDLTLKNKPLITVSAGTENGGTTMVFDIMPNYAFHLSAEMIQQMTRELAGSMPTDLDATAIANALIKPLDELLAAVSEKVGAPESGEYTVDGYAFNTRIPVNITEKEAQLMLLKYAKAVVSDPAVKPLAEQISGLDAAGIDESIAREEQYGSDTPLDIVIYGDVSAYGAASKTYAVIKMDRFNTLYVGQLDSCFVFKVAEDNGGHLLYFALDDTEKGALVTVQYIERDTGGYSKYDMKELVNVLVKCDITDRRDGGFESKSEVTYNGISMGTVIFNVTSGASITAPATTQGKTVIPFEDFVNGSSGYQTALMSGVTTLLSRANDAMPDEMSVLLQLMNMGGVSMF